jgi:hypothetical protein
MKLTIVTSRAAAIKLWEIYPDGIINRIGDGDCYATKAGVPLVFPPSGSGTVGPPLGKTELHVQALDAGVAKSFCRRVRSSRSLDGAIDRPAWASKMQEAILRYTVIKSGVD